MDTKNQLVNHKENPIRKWFTNILDKIKNRFSSSKLCDKSIEDEINREFPNESDQEEVNKLLQELLARNTSLLETLNIRMLDKQIVDLFGKAKLERIITDELLQKDILELSTEQLQTYAYILNYNLVDFNERIANLYTFFCEDIDLKQLQSLSEKDRLKAISIILSNREFFLHDLDELNNYYETRRKMCKQIIDNPKRAEEEYEKILILKMKYPHFHLYFYLRCRI